MILELLSAVKVTQLWRFPDPRPQTSILQSRDEAPHRPLVPTGGLLPAGVRSLSSSGTVQLRKNTHTHTHR